MTIEKTINGNELCVAIAGRLDTNTAPELEAAISADIESAGKFIVDMKDLEYISSAGLRVMLSAQKTMNKIGGEMEVHNANDDIKEIFDVTGFSDILTII